VIAFADNLLVMTRGKTILETENFTNSNLQKITNWAFKNKIRFNEQKSTSILITRKRQTSITIFLNNKQLEEVSKFKYLGIIIDNKFTFHDHIQYTGEKCTKLINTLSKSAKLEGGLKYGALRTIYPGRILPLLSYAASVWSKALTKKFNQKRITRVQCL
jgi:hypothetical protein